MKIEEVASGVTGGKGKKKNKKMMIFLIVGGIIVLLLVLMRRQQPASSDAPTTEVMADNYDQLGEMFQNNTGLIQSQVDGQIQNALATMQAQLQSQSQSMDATLKQTIAGLEAQNTGQLNDYFGQLNGYLTERDNDAMEVIKDLQEANEKLLGDLGASIEADKKQQEAIDAATKTATDATKAAKDAEKRAAEAKKAADAAAKKAAEAAKSKMSAPVKSTPPPVKTTPKPTQPKSTVKTVDTDYRGNSLVDALKREGLNSSMSSRDAIAEKNGIKNYSGTAAQNTQLLNRMKSGHLKV